MSLPSVLHSAFVRYSLAVVVMLAAVALRFALVPIMGLNIPYVTVYPAMMFTAIRLGAGPGVLASVVGVLLAEYYFVPPLGFEWDLAFVIRAAIPLLTSLYVGWVSQRLRDARTRADAEAATARTAEAALRQQVELVDPARAEVIMQEMQRVLRARQASEAPPPASPGGQLVRRLLPAVLLVPTGLGLVHVVGERAGLHSPAAGAAVFALAMILSLSALMWWTVRIVNREDAARRQIETQLRNQAELMDYAREPLIVRELGGVIRFWNHGAEALYGWPAAEALGQRTYVLLRAGGVPVAEMEAQLEQTGRWEGELLHATRDGRTVTVESRQAATRAADDRLLILESNRDITARKAAEQTLRESAARLKRAQEIAHLGSWELDLVNNRLSWSDEVYRIFGLQPQEFGATYEAFLEAVHPEDRAAVDAAYSSSLRENRDTYEIEHRVVRKSSGEVRIVHERCQHSRDAGGRIIHSVGMVHDITEGKQAEYQIRRLNAELEQRVAERTAEVREQSRFLEAFYRHSLDSLVFLDKAFNFIRVNEAYAKACGRDVSEFPGYNHFEFYPHAENQAIFENVVRTKTPYQVTAKPFTFPDHPEWGVTYWDWTLVPVLDDDGEVDFLVFSLRDVTGRARAEQEVRAASLYARSLLEASLDPLVTISPEGKVTDVNKATELATGVPRAQLIGSDFADYFTEPDQARAGYQQVLRDGTVRDYPLTIRHVSGRITDVLYNATVYRDQAGRALGVFAAARDVTERKRMECELRESEARYRSLVTASAQIVWRTNPEGEVDTDLPAWREFTGQGLEEIQGWGWASTLHPDDRERTQEVWARSVATRTLYETEYRMRRHDGQYRVFLARGVPVLEEDGQLREWVGTCTDITERKAAETRRNMTSALVELFARKTSSKEYLDAVVKVIQDWSGCQSLGIRVTSDKGQIPFESWSGYSQEFLEKESPLCLHMDACVCIRAITRSIETPDRALVTANGSFRCENLGEFVGSLSPEQQERYRGACARQGYKSLAVVPIRYQGQILGAIHLADPREGHFRAATVEFIESMSPLIGEAILRFRAEAELEKYREGLEELVKLRTAELEAANTELEMQIAERRRAEETLRQTAEDLKRSNSDLEQFAYVASHDLQEPLRAVAGYVGLLQRRYHAQLDAKAIEYIDGAVDGATRMQTLINDLLAFSRVGTRGKTPEATDLKAVLDETLINLSVGIGDTDVRITHDPLPTVRADPTQMAQLFQNLLGNALKFRGERPPEIHLGAQRQEGRWLLSVRDNGIGIDPQYAQRIFQIFQRLHTRRAYPGTGIGLAICKKVVERHGGRIWVESQPGQGATFYFTIPD